MERCWRDTGELPPDRDPNHHSWLTGNSDDFWRVDNVPHLGQPFLDYVTHPRLTAIVEEMIGVTAPPSTAGASLPLGQDSDPVS